MTLAQWIPAVYLPVTTPVTGFNARTDLLNLVFFTASRDNVLNALKTQQTTVWYYRFDWDKEPAPWNDIYGAATPSTCRSSSAPSGLRSSAAS